ncbi:hypothetical protein [Pseudofrankia sp. DC12]|uniref:hypothetical protein n=1 Tax=Pseudofrankia sp. DC12 TaxID=683315 RepID=UPI0012FC5B1E|nr:hypothetical protein [Pseudofrankia sp. DC12]
MIEISSLAEKGEYVSSGGSLDADPLRVVDALQEVQLLDCKVSPLTATAALLFELRTALQIDIGNSAVLVVRGLRKFSWSWLAGYRPLVAATIVSSAPKFDLDSFTMEFGLFPDADLIVTGNSAEFYLLEVDGIGEAIPNYVDADLASIRGALPTWSSRCTVLQASSSR